MATLLIADDDPLTRSLVRTVMTYAGHAVVEARNGDEALDRAADAAPDLILLDLSLSGPSGGTFIRALRADSRTNGIPIALYTATPMSAALRDFMEIYGIKRAIPKPCEPQELITAIESALGAA